MDYPMLPLNSTGKKDRFSQHKSSVIMGKQSQSWVLSATVKASLAPIQGGDFKSIEGLQYIGAMGHPGLLVGESSETLYAAATHI